MEKMMIRLRIKEIAEAKGFNQSSLSRAADVHFSTVKRIFRDPYREVTSTTLDKVARALGVPICDLIEELPEEVVITDN
jgi:DNA-binding Xre family transcriptional regulator